MEIVKCGLLKILTIIKNLELHRNFKLIRWYSTKTTVTVEVSVKI